MQYIFLQKPRLPVDSPWNEALQPYLDASKLIIKCGGGVVKDLSLYRLRFCIHNSSSAFAFVERFTFSSPEFWVIIPWICWWREQYWRGDGSEATALEDGLPITLLDYLTVTVSFFDKFFHLFVTFSLSSWEASMSFSGNLFLCLAILKLMLVLESIFLYWWGNPDFGEGIVKYLELITALFGRLL